MKVGALKVSNTRSLKAIIGMSQAGFDKLLVMFTQTYYEIYLTRLKNRAPKELRINYKIKSEKQLLLLALVNLKENLSIDLLASIFKLDISNAHKNRQKALGVLYKTLENFKLLPATNQLNNNDILEYLATMDSLTIDATEQPINRPANNQIQIVYYSGKKKCHTIKTLIIVNDDKKILYINSNHPGSIHDYTILKYCFDPQQNPHCFAHANVKVDLGFQGIASDYQCGQVSIPHKKPKNGELTAEQKQENKVLASKRIIVEHCIGGVKRFRILSGTLRMKDFDLYEKIFAICAGLWNFLLSVSQL